jgi:hypothetical protein
VGDLRQAIYAWRGATPDTVVGGWERDYPAGRRAQLGVNYRSRPDLVQAFGVACGEGAQTWQAARKSEAAPDEIGARAPTPPPLLAASTLAVAPDAAAQADNMAQRMREFAAAGYAWGAQAVLCRTRAQAAALRAELAARNVPVEGASGDQGGGSLPARTCANCLPSLRASTSRKARPGIAFPICPPGLSRTAASGALGPRRCSPKSCSARAGGRVVASRIRPPCAPCSGWPRTSTSVPACCWTPGRRMALSTAAPFCATSAASPASG